MKFTMKCVLLFVCVFLSAGVSAEDPLPWWKTAVLYQVYPRSFMDSNGDGIGDLKGITQQASHFKDIGVTAIWLSPIFKSPMADFGYDISDFRSIDPNFGTLDDFQDLIQTLKKLDIKVLLDLVPNHSSDQHQWFQWSVEGKEPYKDYYVWSDGKKDPITNQTVPINNWKAVFNGSAWEWRDERKQFYLHQFLVEQPDLNYANPAVITEMEDLMKFWLDFGVDGFRVDATPMLVEDPLFRDEPPLPGTSGQTFFELDHIYTQNVEGTYVLCQRWAEFIYNYSKTTGTERALYMEAYANISSLMKYYGHGNESLMMPFNFQLVAYGNQSSRSHDIYDLIMSWMTNITKDDTPNWVTGNHDNKRVATKYGPEIVDAMNLLTGVLPGVKVTYYGEEIGMSDTFVRWDQTVDNMARLAGPTKYLQKTRDPGRTPMQWNDSDNAGFTSGKPWLPVNPDYWHVNVAEQRSAAISHMKVFRAMADARKDPVLQRGSLNITVPDNDTLVVIRTYNSSWYSLIINFGSEVKYYKSQSLFEPLGLDADMTIVTSSINSGIGSGLNFQKGGANVSLRPRAAVLLRKGTTTNNSAPFSYSANSLLLAAVALAANFINLI